MDAPREIVELVERFARQLDAYRSGQYKEAQLRSEFIDPFFEALGWDVHNKQGYAEAYKDVIHEDAIKVGGATKAPDYCFRIGGARKFFVEAKKPSIDIKEAVHPAYQLRRYAWSAKLPLSILTDFEEFAAYDCTVKPADTDKASTARVLYLTYNEYSRRWDDIASIFSRDAVLKGSFDKYAESAKRKKGTAEVDSAFLKEIESWRESLARHIALRNPDLSQRELNFAIQRTIDRIIFLRICEDRGIEHYGQLMALLNGTEVYARLCQVLYRADERYNSGLFYFQKEKDRADAPDELTPRLAIDDKPLKDIIRRLYYPESPYEFSVLPADILGQVYEQFLGKVIRLTAGHRAVVEDKPEVKKAGGIYYTPTYIVDYIVRNTVGKLLEGSVARDQGAGVRDRGSEKGGKPDGDSDVSGPGGVAEEHGAGSGDISAGEALSAGGAVRVDQPNPTGGGLDSREHSGGPRPAPPPGLSSVSLHSEGIPDGTGDSLADCGQAGVPGPGEGQTGLDSASRRGASAQRTNSVPRHQEARRQIQEATGGAGSQSQRLTPDPRSPTPDPRHPTPKEVANLRILDPACGSGSFLIGAYQYLLDWHLNWYAAHDPETWARKKNPPIRQTSGPRPPPPDPRPPTPSYRLTTSERKRILLNNIYGVDIDPQAVEVTKLSLLLKVLEGENEETLEKQFRLFRERALPDLGRNIKCGNSLIGPDFYDNQQMTFLDEDERCRINAFDWNAEFPEIIKSGGFDAVIGNPPYGAPLSAPEGRYLSRRFALQDYQLDTYLLFMEGGLELVKAGGLLGMIIPNTWLLNLTNVRIRKHLFSATQVENVVHYRRRVFARATVDTEVAIISNRPPTPSHKVRIEIMDREARATRYGIPQRRWRALAGAPVNILERPDVIELADKLRGMTVLDASFVVTQGAKPFQVGKGKPAQTRRVVDEKPFVSDRRVDRTFRPLLRGSLINRYRMIWNRDYWVSFGDWLAEPRYSAQYDAPLKIVVRQTGDSLVATLDRDQFVIRDNLYTILPRHPEYDLRFALGLLNSRLLNWYYQTALNPEKGEALAQVKRGHLARLPIVMPEQSDPEGARRHARIVKLVDWMLELHKRLGPAKTEHEKTVLQRQIDATDRQIDSLVYELYGLTDEEIKTVEAAT